MKKTPKVLFTVLASLAVYGGLAKLINEKMHGFSYQNFKIMPPDGYDINFENSQNVASLFLEPFCFYSFGGESLVFLSKDQKWVLKVFKKHRLYHWKFLHAFKHLPILKSFLEKRNRVYNRFWQSLKLQAEQLKNESGLVYVNLPNKQDLFVDLIDPIGSKHHLNLGKVCFVIQKKGEMFKQTYLNTKSAEQREMLLARLVDFYKLLENKGLKIWDNAISRNVGLVDGQPFLVDTGAVCPKMTHDSFENNVKHLKSWIIHYDPAKLDYVLALIAAEKAIDAF